MARINSKRGLKLVALILIVLVILIVSGRWLYHYMTHIHEIDARIEGHVTTISSRLPGWLVKFDLVEGDRVKQGDVLALVDRRDAVLALHALQAREQAMAAQVEQIQTQIELATGQTGGEYDQAQRELDAANAAVLSQQSVLHQAQEDYQRAEQLAQDKVIPKQARDHAYHTYQEAQQVYAQSSSRVRAAAAAVAAARAKRLGPEVLRKQLDVLSHQLAELQAQRQRQELDVQDRVIQAPIPGLIDKTLVERGEYVSPGQGLLMMHDPADIYVEAQLKETLLSHVKIGQAVDIHVDAFPDRQYTGRVERIVKAATNQFALLPDPNPSGNFTKVTQRIPVRIRLDHPDAYLSPGMMVEVDIDTRG
jgi:membrane fusion protein (multidrug efflux system)